MAYDSHNDHSETVTQAEVQVGFGNQQGELVRWSGIRQKHCCLMLCLLTLALLLQSRNSGVCMLDACTLMGICTNAVVDDDEDAWEEVDDDPCDPPASNDGPEGGSDPCANTSEPEGSGNGSAGMPVWRVSEPYINLWIQDVPLQYRLSSGRLMQLRLNYKQRSSPRETNYAGFGPNWECNWIGVMINTNTTPDTFKLHKPGGGRIIVAVPGGAMYDPPGSRVVRDGEAIYILSPTGAKSVYGRVGNINIDPTRTFRFRTNAVDRYGRVTHFVWAPTIIGSITNWRLNSIRDRDGRVCTIAYTNTKYPHLITSVTSPYGHTAHFVYDHLGRLTNIIDMAGMSSSFQYDGASAVIIKMITPYGETRFRHFSGEVGGHILNRAIEITEPTGEKQLYAYRDNGIIGGFSAGGTYACDDPATAYRNSYHWDRKQYAEISALGKANPLNMPVEDYWKASLKHWLLKPGAPPFISGTPSAMAGPVLQPEISDTRCSQVFMKYQGQTTPFHIGTIKRVTRIVWNGTDYYAGSSICIDIERNQWGRPTSITYYANGQPVTYTMTYNEDGRVLKTVTGPRGELVRGYGYHPVVTNLLTSVTNALNEVLRYTHDLNGMKVTSITYPSGLVTTNIYYSGGDSGGFVAQRIDIGFRTNSFTYEKGNVKTHTDELGLSITNTWDNLNRLTSTW
ncbi:MAG: hypothetical protein RMN51_08505 [Verrucomicrobiota bacterium]|nr:hypothetical protein [Verrucomicrobiota bacterium]